MKLCLLTIVIDGMRFLPAQFYTFNRLSVPWEWHVVEGVAMPVKDTGWCKPQPPRLSKDGTFEFLETISKQHENVYHYYSESWDGKTEMVNHPLETITQPCVLVQVDMDELWTPAQLERISKVFDKIPNMSAMRFFCRYFVGPDIITVGENCYGNNPSEWLRAWRFTPGDRFEKHEPPILRQRAKGPCASREWTRAGGMVFDHYAYAFEEQVRFKEAYYGYTDAVKQWRRLQENRQWPVKRLKDYLPWVDDRVEAKRL